MAYGIIKNHGGHIACQSSPGAGTTFQIYLPAIIAVAQADADIPETPIQKGEGETILVVDDDAMAGEMTGAVLEEMGHEAVLAEDGVDAAAKLNADSGIGMVISDMNMPMVSGIDLFRELREQGSTLPFILLTGDAPDGLLAQEPRLDACMLKDFSLEESLPQVLAEVLAKHGLS